MGSIPTGTRHTPTDGLMQTRTDDGLIAFIRAGATPTSSAEQETQTPIYDGSQGARPEEQDLLIKKEPSPVWNARRDFFMGKTDVLPEPEVQTPHPEDSQPLVSQADAMSSVPTSGTHTTPSSSIVSQENNSATGNTMDRGMNTTFSQGTQDHVNKLLDQIDQRSGFQGKRTGLGAQVPPPNIWTDSVA